MYFIRVRTITNQLTLINISHIIKIEQDIGSDTCRIYLSHNYIEVRRIEVRRSLTELHRDIILSTDSEHRSPEPRCKELDESWSPRE